MARAHLILAMLLLAAQPAMPQTLSPGKPAGVNAAQRISQRSLFIGGSAIAIALAFGLPASTPTSAATSTATSTATTS